MAASDWKEFRNGFTSDFQIYTDVAPVFPPGATIPVISTKLQSGGTIPKIWGYLYDGPDIVFPSKFCGVAITGGGQFLGSPANTNFRVGPLIAMSHVGDNEFYKGTPTPNADLDIIMCGLHGSFGTITSTLRSLRLVDGVRQPTSEVTSQSPFHIPEVGSTNRAQFEVGFFLDDVVPTEEQFRMFYRYNAGTAFQEPGGPDWIPWRHLGDYSFSTDLVGAGIDVSSGFFPGFGFWVDSTAIDWDDLVSSFFLDFDHIYVTNYTEIPP